MGPNFIDFLRKVSFSIILLLVCELGFGQSISNYNVTRSTGITYSSISGTGSSVPSWRNGTSKDNRSNAIDLGFDFWYMGERYSSVSICTNGYIDFSSSTATGAGTGAYGWSDAQFTSNTGTLLALAPYYYVLGHDVDLSTNIKYEISGTEPNRVLTVEWIDMEALGSGPATYKADSDYDFQLKIYEATGVIEFIYSSFTVGSSDVDYTCGINGPTQSATATADELLCQQSPNTDTFNNTEVTNLGTVPDANTMIDFTPTNIAAAPSNLTFSNVNTTSMDLSWTDNSANEIGFAIYGSTDGGTSYDFLTTVTANSTTATVTGLTCATYDFKVYAITEFLSTPLTGTQATLMSCATNLDPADTYVMSCGNDITLGWDDLPCADSYKVYLDKVDGTTLVSNEAENYYVTGALDASTVYYWKVVPSSLSEGDAAGCAVQTFTTNTAVTNPTAPDVSRCSSGTVTLAASAGEYDPDYLWYDAATGGNVVGSGANFTTPSLSSSTNYYVSSVDLSTTGSLDNSASGGGNNCAASTSSGAFTFDITNLNASDILITSISTDYIATTGNRNTEIYYRSGTGSGFELNSSGWTEIFNGSVAVAASNSTTIDVQDIVVGSGETVGIYFWTEDEPNTVRNAGSSNADITITPISTNCVATGGSFTGGSANAGWALDGTVFYSILNTCETNRTECTAVVNPNPGTTLVTDGERCGTGTVGLSASGALTGENYKWYDAATGGTLLQTNGASYTTPSIAATTNYYAVRYNTTTSCESSPRTEVTATVKDFPTAPTTISVDNGTICSSDGTATLTVTDGNLGTDGTWEWYTGSCAGTSVGSGSPFTVTPTANTTYYVRAENSCGNTTCTDQTINVPTLPTAADQSSCSVGSFAMTVTGGDYANYYWYDAPGGNLLGSGGTYNTPSISATTPYYVTNASINTTSALSNGTTGSSPITGPDPTDFAYSFDITVSSADPLIITSFQNTTEDNETACVTEVYYRTGTAVGFEGSSTGWTQVYSQSVNYTGGTPLTLDIDDIKVQNGDVIGFYVFMSKGEGLTKSNSSASNADIAIGEGRTYDEPGTAFSGVTLDADGASPEGDVSYVKVTCESPSVEAYAIVNSAPSVGIQPSTESACLGSTINYTVEATGSELTYQWRKDAVNLTDGGDVSGATTSALAIATAAVSDNGAYDVVITNSCGSVTSNSATLAVSDDPTINTQPSNTTGCRGSTMYLDVDASGVGLTYQWQTDAGGSWANVADGTPTDFTYSGSTSANLVAVAGATAAFATSNYRCIVSTSCPGSVTTTTATITVVAGAPLNQPSVITSASGEGICNDNLTGHVLSVTLDPGATSYQWTVPTGATITTAGNTNSETFDFVANFHDSIKVQAINGCGPSIPRAIDIMVGINWTGATDENWENVANWCPNAIPTASDNVYIGSGKPNYPSIDESSGAAYCKDFEMESGATVDITPKIKWAGQSHNTNLATLFVYGNFENNGTINQNYFTSKFKGINVEGIIGLYLYGVGKTISGSGSFGSKYPDQTNFLTAATGKGMVWLAGSASYTLKANLPSDVNTKLHDFELLNATNSLDLNGYQLTTNAFYQAGTLTAPSGSVLSLQGVDGAYPWLSANSFTPANTTWSDGSTFKLIAPMGPNTPGGTPTDNVPATNTTMLYNDDFYDVEFDPGVGNSFTRGANLDVSNNITITDGTLNGGTGMVITVGHDWINNGTFTAATSDVQFTGTVNAQQEIKGSSATTFYDLTINNTVANGEVILNQNTTATNEIEFTDGVITTGANTMILSNTAAASVIHSTGNASFVNGNFRRNIVGGGANNDIYEFPVGDGTASTNYKRIDYINNLIDGPSYLDVSVSSLSESGNNIDSRLTASARQDGSQITNIYSDAIWTIVPDASPTGGSYGVNLYIENVSGPTDNTFTVLKRDDGSTDYADWSTYEATTTIPEKDNAGRTVASGYGQRLGFTTFSEFGNGGGPQYPLSIDLLTFQGKLIENDVHLKWITSSEINNDYFIVEKSIDNQNFIEIGEVTAAGNSNRPISYSYVDEDITENRVYYYRLKQVDFDGKYSYTRSIVVKLINSNGSISEFKVYPNPVKNVLTISYLSDVDNDFINYTVTDVMGKTIYSSGRMSKPTKGLLYNLNVEGLPVGLYTIRMIAENGAVFNEKFIKQ